MENKLNKKIESIHFVGIKGVGMAPLAIIAREAGFAVTGSDIADGFITDVILKRAGIDPQVGFDPSRSESADLVITTGAHGGYDNPEVRAAKAKKIPVLTQGQAVGLFMQGELFGAYDQIGISIAGTHGKTTTTAMVATILKEAALDPSWVVGTSEIPSLGLSGHLGEGRFFVAEADEYANEPTYDKTPKLLLQHPSIAVITNIEHDHPDVYSTLEDLSSTFLRFAQNLPEGGILIACGDDPEIQKIRATYVGKVVTYGWDESNDYQLIADAHKHFIVIHKSKEETSFTLGVAGKHNGLNALAALLVGNACGVSFVIGSKALAKFSGTKRRMEYVGQLSSGALLYDDYAHHPTEIKTTLRAFKETYSEKNIICVFQPHTFSRTKLLFEEFVDSLQLADEIIIAEIYPSQREAHDSTISSNMLVGAINKHEHKATFALSLRDVVECITNLHPDSNSLIITMGAGDIYTIAQQLLHL